MLGLDQFVNQCRGGSESHAALLPAGGHRQSGEQMSFAGTAVAYKDDGLGTSDIITVGQPVKLLR